MLLKKRVRERNTHPLAPLSYETNFFLAAQFAPQGNQAERSEAEQRECRACIGNSSHADVIKEIVPGGIETLEHQRRRAIGGQEVVKGECEIAWVRVEVVVNVNAV